MSDRTVREGASNVSRPSLAATREGWTETTVLKACRNIVDYRGRTPKKLGLDWGGGDIPALSAGNVKMGYIDFAQECYFGSDELYRRWMTSGHAAKGDIVVTLEAPLGNVALIPDDRRYILSQRTVLLQLDQDVAQSAFVFQQLVSSEFQRALVENATGSTAQGIRRQAFEALPIALPPLPQQRPIAAALADTDSLLAALDRLIAKKRDLKQATVHQLVRGERRLPGFGGEWEAKRLGDVCAFKTGPFGSALHKSDYVDDGVPVVNPMHILDGTIVAKRGMTITGLAARRLSEFLLRSGDVVMARRGDMGRCAVVRPHQAGWLCGTGSLIVRSVGSAVPEFIQRILSSSDVIIAIENASVGSTMTNLNQHILRQVSIFLPDIPEQAAITAVLSDIDAELLALEQRRDKTLALKQGMMQELLTGRIRLV
jgi:type I restriction enzyme S subunit